MKKKYLPLIAIAITSISSCEVDNMLNEDTLKESKGLHISTIDETKTFSSNSDEKGMQEAAYSDYEKLLSLLKVSQEKSLQRMDYPPYYGGCFVDGDKLVVLVKENTDYGYLRDRLPNVIFKVCKYSYNELKVAEVAITDILNKGVTGGDNVVMYGIDEVNNSIVVFFKNNSKEAQQNFIKEVSKFPSIKFDQCTEIEDHSLASGDAIYANDGGTIGQGSIGYRAIDNYGNKGIVTAGHCISTNESLSTDRYLNNNIGYCTKSEYNNGYLDAAFCVITDMTNNAPTNRIRYMTNPSVDTLHTALSQPPANVYINMIGYQSGHRNSGIVKFSSMNLNQNGSPIITDAILSTYSTTGGDSGGLVYSLVSSINKRYTVGINKGSTTLSDGNRYAITIKAYLINNRFNLTRY